MGCDEPVCGGDIGRRGRGEQVSEAAVTAVRGWGVAWNSGGYCGRKGRGLQFRPCASGGRWFGREEVAEPV